MDENHRHQHTFKSLTKCLVQHRAWIDLDEKKQSEIMNDIVGGCLEAAIVDCRNDGILISWQEKQFSDRYNMMANKVLSVLDSDINAYAHRVLGRLLSGTISAKNMAFMEVEELCSEANEDIRSEIEMRKKQKVEIKVSTMYRCKKCKNNLTIPVEQQTRSLDEASKHSVKCIECEHIWSV